MRLVMRRNLAAPFVVGIILVAGPVFAQSPSPTSPSDAVSHSTSPASTEPAKNDASRQWKLPVPSEMTFDRPEYGLLGASHQRFLASGEPKEKMLGATIDLYAALPETLPSRLVVSVSTEGAPVEFFSTPGQYTEGTTKFRAYNSLAREIEFLGEMGEIVNVAQFAPIVSVIVDSKDDIRRIASFPFVYGIGWTDGIAVPQLLRAADPSSDYSLTWIQKNEKIDKAWSSRNAVDGSGNGAMPTEVVFAVLDTGYDETNTFFQDAYAKSQIVHCHYWAATPSGDLSWSGPMGSNPLGVPCGLGGDNRHGTHVADILDTMNGGGGTIHIHNLHDAFIGNPPPAELQAPAMMRRAYDHILLAHQDVRVISTSVGLLFANHHNCRGNPIDGLFDDVLQNLVTNRHTLISGPRPNPFHPVTGAPIPEASTYPGDTTWFITTGGVDKGVGNWNAQSHPENMNLSPGNCNLQWNFHQLRDGNTFVAKPDAYGFYTVQTDTVDPSNPTQNIHLYGNSYAQPQIASGLGTIQSRVVLGQHPDFPMWKFWCNGVWNGAAKVVHASAAPNGEAVVPVGAAPLGRLADHDAWFLDSLGC